MLHALELELIHFVHQFRSPLLDQFFKALDFFDKQEFFFVLIPLVWLSRGWKTGLRLFYILLLSSFTNNALKEFFLLPRPFHLDPNVGIIQISGLGFPSGAAQTVILLSGLLLNFWKSSWKWVLVASYILLISFSRVYLGVHFPTDILGGWIVGLGLWAIYTYLRPPLEKQLEKFKPLALFVLSLLIPLMLLLCQHSTPAIRTCSVAIGIGIGLFIVHHSKLFLSSSKNAKESAVRATIGVLGTFACYALTLLLPASNSILYLFSRFLFLGLWLSLGSHLVCRKLSLQFTESSK